MFTWYLPARCVADELARKLRPKTICFFWTLVHIFKGIEADYIVAETNVQSTDETEVLFLKNLCGWFVQVAFLASNMLSQSPQQTWCYFMWEPYQGETNEEVRQDRDSCGTTRTVASTGWWFDLLVLGPWRMIVGSCFFFKQVPSNRV